MKKIIYLILVLVLLSAGCKKVVLQQDKPSSPAASYEQLPR